MRNNMAGRPAQMPPPERKGGGCLPYFMFGFGFLFAAILAAVGVFFFYFYSPSGSSEPLDRPPAQSGTPDASVTLAQAYLNEEMSRQIAGKPIKAGPADVRDVVLRVIDNGQVEVEMRAGVGALTFDAKITEEIAVDSTGQIRLRAVGTPTLVRGELPPTVNNIINELNKNFIEPQINRQLNQVTVNGQRIRLVKVSTRPGFLTVDANIG